MANKTDVLICGSGSAGIFAATWLAQYGIEFTMLERRSGPMKIGQADGVQCRTVEIYESFGLSEEVLREAYHILEVCFWGDDVDGTLTRKRRAMDTENGLSHMPHVILNQARMNGLMLGKMEELSGGEKRIQYGWEIKSLEVDEALVRDPQSYCCKVVAEKDGKEEVWMAKYVLGCDGAHSSIRRSLGFQMVGDTSDTVWGVMDIYPQTNFPDIRRKSTLHTKSGNLLIIPREGGSLVRFYIQLPPGSHAKDVKLEDLQSTAKQIFAPYHMEFAETFWWSAYSIGQRIADNFHKNYRVFLTGDACHTHSPKAGQGMNVSLQDGYNLGWKLASVLTGVAPQTLLRTYVLERTKTAEKLIEFDRVMSKKFSSKEQYPGEFAEYFIKSGKYTAGLTAKYDDSMITDVKESQQQLAKACIVGMRFPSAQSNGKWRILIFAGDINKERQRRRLEELSNHLKAIALTFTPRGPDIDSLIEPIVVLKSKFLEAQQELIPDYFWPVTGRWRIRDLHKVYIDDEHYNAGPGHAYEKYGVDREAGAVVIVRPDQYVSKVTGLNDFEGIQKFFGGCMCMFQPKRLDQRL